MKILIVKQNHGKWKKLLQKALPSSLFTPLLLHQIDSHRNMNTEKKQQNSLVIALLRKNKKNIIVNQQSFANLVERKH